jgi:hypothetical protein
MIDSLSTNIRSLSKGSRATVSSLIRSMKVDKDQLSSLVASINSFSVGEDFAAGVVVPFSVMNREILIDLFRDSFIRMSRLFRVLNSTSVAISSMVDVFSSEIKKLENDIATLETFADTYEFTSGKDDLYDFGYIEKFNDSLNFYTSDGVNFPIPDRSGDAFNGETGGYIDQFSGTFKMGNSYESVNVLENIKSINIESNYQDYVTSSSDFMSVFTETLKDSWTTTVKSPHILSATLDHYSKYITYSNPILNGAQTAVHIDFNSPVTCDSIRLVPNDGRDMYVSQIILFTDEYFTQSSNISSGNSSEIKPFKTVLEHPVSLSSLSEISFGKVSIDKMIIIFNQIGYLRSKIVPIKSEINSKLIQHFMNYKSLERAETFSESQDVVYRFMKERTDIEKIRKSNRVNYSYYSNSFPNTLKRYVTKMSDRLRMFNVSDKISDTGIVGSPVFVDLVNSMASSLDSKGVLFETHNYIDRPSSSRSIGSLGSSSFMISKNSNFFDYKTIDYSRPVKVYGLNGITRALASAEKADAYEYAFSVQSMEFLLSNNKQVDKAVFVSRKIPISSHVEAIKASCRFNSNDSVIVSEFDIPSSISYELSISNSDYPVNESDWQPLAFSGEDSIDSEVLFFNSSTYTAPLRFRPLIGTIKVYIDGFLCDPLKYSYNSITNSITINEIILNSNSNSVYSTAYELNKAEYSPDVIDFVKDNSFKETVKRYESANGFGQVFDSAMAGKVIKLDYMPYVKSSNISSRIYSDKYGTIFYEGDYGNSYKPITIRFDDGTYGIDLTNYTDSPQKVSFYTSNQILFISNGREIIFDRQVNQGFTVDYEYIPYSLRFRMVLRKNLKNIDSLFSVDALLLKLKTSNKNPFYDKLSKISISS